jgi:hypothetical protein
MIHYFLYQQDVVVCIIVLIVIIVALWLFFGGQKYEFVGLNPLHTSSRITPYISTGHPLSYAETHYDLWTDEEYTDVLSSVVDPEEVDTTPCLPSSFESVPPATVKSKRFESKGEKKCREVMEYIYDKPFPCVRPQFLRNPETGRLMELDCYNEELKIAVEYNGVQHYVFPNYTNQSYEDFINQRRRDQFKVNLCDLNEVYLITVPFNVKHEDIHDDMVYYLPENVQQRRIEEIQRREEAMLLSTEDFNETLDY